MTTTRTSTSTRTITTTSTSTSAGTINKQQRGHRQHHYHHHRDHHYHQNNNHHHHHHHHHNQKHNPQPATVTATLATSTVYMCHDSSISHSSNAVTLVTAKRIENAGRAPYTSTCPNSSTLAFSLLQRGRTHVALARASDTLLRFYGLELREQNYSGCN